MQTGNPRQRRIVRGALAGACFAGHLSGIVAAQPAAGTARPPATAPEVHATRAQIRDAWVASDAAVFGTYAGVDSALGPAYHVLQVADVWLGTPARGRLVFKAPRGIRVRPGAPGLFFLWDRLAGVTDAYLREARERWGERTLATIGPDSIATYLLPFPAYALAFDGDRLRLRGGGAFRTEVDRAALKDELLDLEIALRPPSLYRTSAAVVRARVAHVEEIAKTQSGVLVELRIAARMRRLETYKGAVPDSLALEYPSFPRAPRFREGEEVILFLGRGAAGPYLEHGKRAVFHVENGAVVETGRPLAAFVQDARGG